MQLLYQWDSTKLEDLPRKLCIQITDFITFITVVAKREKQHPQQVNAVVRGQASAGTTPGRQIAGSRRKGAALSIPSLARYRLQRGADRVRLYKWLGQEIRRPGVLSRENGCCFCRLCTVVCPHRSAFLSVTHTRNEYPVLPLQQV